MIWRCTNIGWKTEGNRCEEEKSFHHCDFISARAKWGIVLINSHWTPISEWKQTKMSEKIFSTLFFPSPSANEKLLIFPSIRTERKGRRNDIKHHRTHRRRTFCARINNHSRMRGSRWWIFSRRMCSCVCAIIFTPFFYTHSCSPPHEKKKEKQSSLSFSCAISANHHLRIFHLSTIFTHEKH